MDAKVLRIHCAVGSTCVFRHSTSWLPLQLEKGALLNCALKMIYVSPWIFLSIWEHTLSKILNCFRDIRECKERVSEPLDGWLPISTPGSATAHQATDVETESEVGAQEPPDTKEGQ